MADKPFPLYYNTFFYKETDGIKTQMGLFAVRESPDWLGPRITVILNDTLVAQLKIAPERQKRYFRIEFEGIKSPHRESPNNGVVAEIVYEVGDPSVDFVFTHRVDTNYAQADDGSKRTAICFLGSFVKIIDEVSGELLIKGGPMVEVTKEMDESVEYKKSNDRYKDELKQHYIQLFSSYLESQNTE